jgi:hypothetical protein
LSLVLFVFYNKGQGIQQIFTSKGIKHCNVICFCNGYLLFETDKHGITYRSMSFESWDDILNCFKSVKSVHGLILTKINEKKNISWFPLWMRTCNELCRYVTGIDVGFTLNPTHLVKKLLKYDNRTNYEIINQWWSSKDEQSG